MWLEAACSGVGPAPRDRRHWPAWSWAGLGLGEAAPSWPKLAGELIRTEPCGSCC